ncbi:MAG TPA: hypothetical protein PKC95_12020, partial [Thauera aminoaromatica]|nr:hypothetical protein [Thauera aminoaromatica]
MSQLIEVKVPDIGDFDAVPVIELFVKVGDTIAVDDAIATLESDKATMDVPSPAAGVVKEVLINLGDKVSEGTVLIKVEVGAAVGAAAAANRRGMQRFMAYLLGLGGRLSGGWYRGMLAGGPAAVDDHRRPVDLAGRLVGEV